MLPRQVLHRALELVHVLKVVRLGCRQRKRVLHEVCGIALAAAAGGTVHGFFLNESSLGSCGPSRWLSWELQLWQEFTSVPPCNSTVQWQSRTAALERSNVVSLSRYDLFEKLIENRIHTPGLCGTSFSSKRMAWPSWVARKTTWWPSVTRTS